jgi:hypothetical protein
MLLPYSTIIRELIYVLLQYTYDYIYVVCIYPFNIKKNIKWDKN